MGGKPKRVTKKSKTQKVGTFNSAGNLNSAQGRKFRSLAPFLSSALCFFFYFWFFICSYELNLDSPWLS